MGSVKPVHSAPLEGFGRVFDHVGASVWIEDFGPIRELLASLRDQGIEDEDLRAHLEASPELVSKAIGSVRILDVNRETLRMFRAEDKHELIQSLDCVFLPETRRVFVDEILALAEGRSLFEAETKLRALDGSELEVQFRVDFGPTAADVGCTVVTVTDITERVEAERTSKEEARTLSILSHVGRVLTGALDLQGVMQAVTDGATAVARASFGAFFHRVEDEDGEGLMLFTLSGAPRAAFERFGMPRPTALFAPTFAGERPVRVADVLRDSRYGLSAPHHGMPDGHLPVRSYLAVPVIAHAGEVLGGLFLGHPEPDVFDERAEALVAGIASQAAIAVENWRLQAQRIELIDRLREGDRRKDEFLATLAHELRNPLAPLQNGLDLLEGADEAQVEVLRRQVRVLSRLVEDLVAASRIQSGALELRREPLRLASVLEEAVASVEAQARDADQQIQISLPARPVWVDGDRVRLSQVFGNLLSNALKYSDPGSRIALVVEVVEGHAVVRVRDRGAGISEEALPHIFELFNRGDQAVGHRPEGLGVGLALALQIVHLHHGELEAHSEGPGRGSSFIVRLPLVEEPDDTEPSEEASPAVLQGLRVLVADDNVDAATVLGKLLERRGAEVRLAFDGKEAEACYRAEPADVVLLDLGMPGVDGFEAARRIRALPSGARCLLVALSGWGPERAGARAVEAGFDRHFTKPLDLPELIRSLEQQAARGDIETRATPDPR